MAEKLDREIDKKEMKLKNMVKDLEMKRITRKTLNEVN